jgi:thiol-disulfide isomerase/thioredoxin
VRLSVENYGDSELARRFGVTRYPAVFVDDVLVAKPKDFGFYGKGEGGGDGRYTPWRDAQSHARFQADLARMIDHVLAGRKDVVRAEAASAAAAAMELQSLPPFTLTDLAGRSVSRDDLAGRVVLVEFWATWCPPCRSTLAWLSELQKRYGDRVVVLGVAIESEEADVRKIANDIAGPRFAMGTPELARAFGDISAVPTLFVFDGQGRAVTSYFGAPPDLHETAERRLAGLLQ